jgi:septal ring factor EnvC (AmiA/AmiB activator)
MEMQGLSPFERLTEKVEALLNRCREALEAQAALESLVKEKDAAIAALKEQVAVIEQERARAREKIDEVLSRIDDFMTG